jgi:hypothetical protein
MVSNKQTATYSAPSDSTITTIFWKLSTKDFAVPQIIFASSSLGQWIFRIAESILPPPVLTYFNFPPLQYSSI